MPWRPWDSPYFKFSQGGPVHPSRAFFGQDHALGLPALYSCVRLLSESLASLPIKIYTRAPGGGSAVRYTGPSIFDDPSTSANTYDWLYQCMTSLLLHGNAWGFITGRDGFGYPTGVDWIAPDMVTVLDDENQPWNQLRTRVFVYGRLVPDWRTDLFHIRAFTVPGRVEGISPLRAFAMTVMSGLESQRFGNDWFASGGFPTGTFQNTQLEVDSDASAIIRSSLTASIRNHEPLVYGRDWEYKPVTVPPSEAQFIESGQFSATMLAAVYGLPPDRVGGKRADSLTYSCVDAETEIMTLRGWLKYSEVVAGDTALTLNTDTGMSEWQPVESVHIYDDGPYPVTKLDNLSHSSATTPNHRWPVMISGRKDARSGYQWRTTETLPLDARICAAAPVVTPTEPKWSDALTELTAWFWTEGWIGKSGAVTLAQSDTVNPLNVARIRAALTELFGPSAAESGTSLLGAKGRVKRAEIRAELDRDQDQSNREIARKCSADSHTVALVRRGKADGAGWQEDYDERGLVHFRLNAEAGSVLLEQAPGKVVSTVFLSQLTRAQLELFIQVSLEADGSRHGASWTMAQKDKTRLDAFQLACALTGRSGVVRGPNKHGMYVMPIQLSPWRKPVGHKEYITQETTGLVWCVQTPNKSWFARRNGTCYFTGNTVEQSTLQVIEALRPWMVRLETAFFDLIPANRYVRFTSDALLKTDLKTRTDIYAAQRNIGMLNIDEIRDMEDRPPLPDQSGAENIPLEVVVAMARSIRGIPSTMLPVITLEMDLAANRLEKLQKEGIAAPDAEPLVKGPASALSGLITGIRGQGADLTDLSDLSSDDVIRILRQASREGRQRSDHREPEFVGPWIPSDRDLAAMAGTNGNENGHGDHS